MISIRSQNKKVNVNFQRKLSTHSFHETEFHEISFNKYLEKHSKTCLPNLSIHGLYSIISHRQYSISQYSCLFYHYINCISTLLDRIIQQLISRSFENLLHKLPNLPIYELSHNLNIQFWFRKWLTLTFNEKYP